jgi:hypothetical protein
MYEINAKEISASIGTVWNIISDVDNEPLYWQNLTVSNARKDGKTTEREVTVGFRDLKVAHAVGQYSRKFVEVSLTEASVIGTRVIILRPAGDNKTRIEVAWDIELSDIPLLFRGMMRNKIMKGTKEALDRIARPVQ